MGRVELGSTFPTITISPTTTDFNGNACLGWSAAIGDIPLFLLKHVSVTAQLELRKKFAAILGGPRWASVAFGGFRWLSVGYFILGFNSAIFFSTNFFFTASRK